MKLLRIGQINISNSQEGYKERFEYLQNCVNENKIQILAVQELIHPEKLTETLKTSGMIYNSKSIDKHLLNFHENSKKEYEYVAVFSKFPIIFSENIQFGQNIPDGLLTILQTPTGNICVITAHFVWGFEKERTRLQQAIMVNEYAAHIFEHDHIPVIFCGDLNTEPDYDTMRYLFGKSAPVNTTSTYWTDPYQMFGHPENFATTDQGHDYWGLKTLQKFDTIVPEITPARRIDYILSYGWVYGRVGCPLSYEIFGSEENSEKMSVSDHKGIYTDILMKK